MSYFRGPWNVTLRHQFWPEILDGSYATSFQGGAVNPLGNVNTSYSLVYLGASYSFADRYTIRFGIENLFDREPPWSGGDPDNSRFPVSPQRIISVGRGGFGAGGSSTYEPLGRRGFVSMTMDF
jgi:outer membrane receptor protein involved in Fe transport